MRIIDIHTHLELNLPGIPGNTHRKKPPRLFMYLNERLGYNSVLWKKGNYPDFIRMLISMDNQIRLSMASVENLIREMDSNDVSVSIVMPIAPYISSQDYLNKIENEPRLLTFATSHPSDQNWIGNLKEAMNKGCRGLKIHPILQELSPQSEFYFNLLEEYRGYGKPVLTHAGEFDYFIPHSKYSRFGRLSQFEKMVSSFSDIPFILGHMGLHDSEGAMQLAVKYENVYLETSFQSVNTVRKALKLVGENRVLFGSDWPEAEQRIPLNIARKVAISDHNLAERILWKNAEDLLGSVDWDSFV